MKISDRERRVLQVLAGHYGSEANCLYFRYIADELGDDIDIRQIRRAVRSLARKGLAQYQRGLFNDEGMVAGSGYCCTPAGKALHESLMETGA